MGSGGIWLFLIIGIHTYFGMLWEVVDEGGKRRGGRESC